MFSRSTVRIRLRWALLVIIMSFVNVNEQYLSCSSIWRSRRPLTSSSTKGAQLGGGNCQTLRQSLRFSYEYILRHFWNCGNLYNYSTICREVKEWLQAKQFSSRWCKQQQCTKPSKIIAFQSMYNVCKVLCCIEVYTGCWSKWRVMKTHNIQNQAKE